jgi:hypothetical protein
MSNDPISFRPTDDDLTAITQLLSGYPYLRDNKHAAISFALSFATQEPWCPNCDSPLKEQLDSGGGLLGIFVCADCADGNGTVEIKT